MILSKAGEQIYASGKMIGINMRVKANSESIYDGLYGYIVEILIGDAKETDNDGPDVYVSFDTPEENSEILNNLLLFYCVDNINDIPLDLIIIDPSMIDIAKEEEY